MERYKILDALRAEGSATIVAQQCKRSVTAVWNIAKAASISLTEARLTPELRAQIIAAARRLKNGTAVAREFDYIVSRQAICDIARKAKVELSYPGRKWPKRRKSAAPAP